MARILTVALGAGFRCDAEVTVSELVQIAYRDHLSDLPNPTYVAVFTVEPLLGRGLLSVELPLAMSVVDRTLGGPGDAPHPHRPLTEIELGLLGELTDRLLAGLAAGWVPVTAFTAIATRQESNPALAKAAPQGTPMVVVTMRIALGTETGNVRLAIPFASVESVITSFTGQGVQSPAPLPDPDAMAESLSERLLDVSVNVGMRFPSVPLTSEEIVSLCVGDIIPLGHPVGHALEMAAEGVAYATAYPGRRGKRLACLIVDTISEDDHLMREHAR